MPELPEVEVLARHLRPLLRGRTIRGVTVRRAKVLRPTSLQQLRETLLGAEFTGLSRRGKYLLFQLRAGTGQKPIILLGHLGMTGRIFLTRKHRPLPKHAAVALDLGNENLVYEDTRYFGRLTLDTAAVERLGPEPRSAGFKPADFARSLKQSRQAIKIKLLDQTLVAGIGNIYASEALFRARIPPRRPAHKLTARQVDRLWRAIRAVLREAIAGGSTVPLNFGGNRTDELFYFGRAPGTPDYYEERLRVYDRAGRPCPACGRSIRRIRQGGRSTFYCPNCQRA
ncbi:MAG TPA: bifunctional DNA-formamidopyrimidine glycosylase/DNA-(apurinic or apyrimidinic site) lyase [Candidatus Acidoferrum sp.]|nr:bifunctional DNA-formamidopyrimidine glycosylase/DNA-(apurinic or apyrimidinic site) lyase [Candidatus Acidoferrum sp.]